jgi:hypothetical protein
VDQKAPRPAPLVKGANRAGKREGFGDAFNSPNTKKPDTQQGAALRGVLLKIKCPDVAGRSAGRIIKDMSAIMAHVFVTDGPRAFDCPKSSATVHEAGHCVIHALNGGMPTRAAIWPEIIDGRTQWLGNTEGIGPWRVDEKTDVQADLRVAESKMAGVAAEYLFDLDFRPGSSIDEIAIARSIVEGVAFKMGRDPALVLAETWITVISRLKMHERIVREIASRLRRKRSIDARDLKLLLAPIKGLR